MPDKQKITVSKRLKMEALEKFGRGSGAHSDEDKEEELRRKKVEVKQGGGEPFGRESGGHLVLVQEQKKGEENLLGLAEWRKKMLRRMG